MAEKIAYEYVGPGFVPGIPARDLTAEEVKEYGEDVIAGIISPNTKQPMYEKAKAKKAKEEEPPAVAAESEVVDGPPSTEAADEEVNE